MKKNRIDELEKNIGEVAPENVELIEQYLQFEKAIKDGDTELASELRTQADPWMKDAEGFRKLAFFPPDGTNIDLTAWHQFVKFNFGKSKS